MKKAGSANLLEGPLVKGILLFAVPIMITGMLQQLFNFADTAIVGKFADETALAAVGTNGEIVALLVTLSSGLSIGVTVRIAGMIGSRNTEHVSDVITTALLLSAGIGILLAAAGLSVSERILQLTQVPAEIKDSALIYLNIYLAGLPFLMFYDFGAAVLRAYGDSRRPLRAMFFSGIINVLLNLLFVTVFHMGVSGVAVSTVISNILSSMFVLYWIISDGLLDHHAHMQFHRGEALSILKIGIPAAVQGAVFCFANIFVQTSVNSLGVTAVAGSAIAMNFEYLTYYSITAFGQAATTFVSQNYAAGNVVRCRKITVVSTILSFVTCFILTFPIVLFRQQFSLIFTDSPAAVSAAGLRITGILLFEPICALYECTAGSLRGIGHSLAPAVTTITGICLFRIFWILSVFPKIHTESALYLSFPLSWAVTSLAMLILYVTKFRAVDEI